VYKMVLTFRGQKKNVKVHELHRFFFCCRFTTCTDFHLLLLFCDTVWSFRINYTVIYMYIYRLASRNTKERLRQSEERNGLVKILSVYFYIFVSPFHMGILTHNVCVCYYSQECASRHKVVKVRSARACACSLFYFVVWRKKWCCLLLCVWRI